MGTVNGFHRTQRRRRNSTRVRHLARGNNLCRTPPRPHWTRSPQEFVHINWPKPFRDHLSSDANGRRPTAVPDLGANRDCAGFLLGRVAEGPLLRQLLKGRLFWRKRFPIFEMFPPLWGRCSSGWECLVIEAHQPGTPARTNFWPETGPVPSGRQPTCPLRFAEL